MDKEIKRRWVEALRSGQYIQGRSKLFEEYKGTFCCLGVLCDIQGVPRERTSQYAIAPFISEAGIPGFEPIQGVISQEEANCLAGMNDKGKTFNEIADYIEETL